MWKISAALGEVQWQIQSLDDQLRYEIFQKLAYIERSAFDH